jgi:hypothetical protein
LLLRRLRVPRTAEAAVRALGRLQVGSFVEDGALDTRDDQLRDAIAASDGEWLLPKICDDDADGTAIIGIDGPRRVE